MALFPAFSVTPFLPWRQTVPRRCLPPLVNPRFPSHLPLAASRKPPSARVSSLRQDIPLNGPTLRNPRFPSHLPLAASRNPPSARVSSLRQAVPPNGPTLRNPSFPSHLPLAASRSLRPPESPPSCLLLTSSFHPPPKPNPLSSLPAHPKTNQPISAFHASVVQISYPRSLPLMMTSSPSLNPSFSLNIGGMVNRPCGEIS